MKHTKTVSKRAVLREMMALACHPVNDAVRLAYLKEGDEQDIQTLDLMAVTEFKRNANGLVEVKLMDRLAVLQTLLAQLEEEDGNAALLQALAAPTTQTEAAVSRR